MRLPHIPKIDWEPIFKLFEKLVVIYKLIEVFDTMFSFFSNIKKRIAALEQDVKAIYGHIKAEFAAKEAAVVTIVQPVTVEPVAAVEPVTTPVEAADAAKTGE